MLAFLLDTSGGRLDTEGLKKRVKKIVRDSQRAKPKGRKAGRDGGSKDEQTCGD